MYFGYSMVAEYYGEGLEVQQANGFIKASGKSDLTYGINGFGEVDVATANKGNLIDGGKNTFDLKGTTISAGQNSFVSFSPYLEVTYELASINGSDSSDFGDSATKFIGHLSTRVVQDFSNVAAFWPVDTSEDMKPDSGSFASNEVFTGMDNKLFYASGNGGKIGVGTFLKFGVNVELELHGSSRRTLQGTAVGDMGLMYNTVADFSFYPSEYDADESCSEFSVSTLVFPKAESESLEKAQWTQNTTNLAIDKQEPGKGAECYANYASRSSAKRHFGDDTLNNSSLSDEGIHDDPLMIRGEPGDIVSFPGDWQYGKAESPPTPNQLLSDSVKDLIGDATEGKLGCKNCGSCVDTLNADEELPCCGCLCMDRKWGYRDIPPYPGCTCCASSPDSGKWPTGVQRIPLGNAKRHFNASGDLEVEYHEDYDEDDDDALDEDEINMNRLERRRSGKAGKGEKEVSICGSSGYAGESGIYPAFPVAASNPWDGIEGGKWDFISKYWGNKSSVCTDWSVGALFPHDNTTLDNGIKERSNYQTEHVFEGQLIGDFFTNWLDQGHVNKQEPMPKYPKPKMKCSDTLDYVFVDPDRHWEWQDGKVARKEAFFFILLRELGSKAHLDCLTVMLGRPNGMKGTVFVGNQAVSRTAYLKQDADEQLQNVKHMGMILEYMNDPVVWDKFCATYEGIYDRLGEWDAFQVTQKRKFPKLQEEWPKVYRWCSELNGHSIKRNFLVHVDES